MRDLFLNVALAAAGCVAMLLLGVRAPYDLLSGVVFVAGGWAAGFFGFGLVMLAVGATSTRKAAVRGWRPWPFR